MTIIILVSKIISVLFSLQLKIYNSILCRIKVHLPFKLFPTLSTRSLVLHHTYLCIKFLEGSAPVMEDVCERPLSGDIRGAIVLCAVHHGNDCNA
jgi:hypothetical protein